MSTKTLPYIASRQAWKLADSIQTMTQRLVDAERKSVEHSVLLGAFGKDEDRLERARWQRVAVRRQRGLRRLVEMLRDLPAGERIDYQEEK